MGFHDAIAESSFKIACDLLDLHKGHAIPSLGDACAVIATFHMFIKERNLLIDLQEWAAEKVVDVKL